jgi:hypothetical protein
MSCSDSGSSRPVLDQPARMPACTRSMRTRSSARPVRRTPATPRSTPRRRPRDEVVEEAVRRLGCGRDDRPDREVRTAGHHVDHRSREEEVELAALDLPVGSYAPRGSAAVGRAASCGRARLEEVGVDGDVHHRREPGVRGRAVVALEEVLGGDLPVARELGLGALEESEASRSIPASAIRSGMPSRKSSRGAASGSGLTNTSGPQVPSWSWTRPSSGDSIPPSRLERGP